MINLNDGSAAKLVKLRTNDGIDGHVILGPMKRTQVGLGNSSLGRKQ